MCEVKENKTLTGYPSTDKPWLKYYSEEAINASLPECTVYEYLYRQNSRHFDEFALSYFDTQATYGELFSQIDKTARAFSYIGVKCGDVVTLCSVTTPETVYAFYALNKLGAVLNTVDPRTSEDGIKHYINEAHSKVLLTLDVAYPKIQRIIEDTAIEKIVVISAADSMSRIMKLGYKLKEGRKLPPISADGRCVRWPEFVAAGENTKVDCPAYTKDTPAVIVHTGGTTGTPKGVVLSNDNLNALAYQFQTSIMGFERRQRFLDIMPPFIAYGIGNGLHMPLCLGMETILIPKFEPEKLDKIILKYKPNVSASVPTHWDRVITSKKLKTADLSFFTHPGVGGDGMKVDLEKRVNSFLDLHHANSKISKGYGLTEVCSAASLSMKNCNEVGSVGIPFLGNTISSFDPITQDELHYNEQGEICISGPTVMLGYYENAEETEKTIRLHADGHRWVHTGDVGYMTEEGILYIVDRIKRVIIRTDGFKIYPSLIENVIARNEAVSACAVVGIPDSEYSQGMLPKAFVVLKNGMSGREAAIEQELKTLCGKELPEYALPAAYAFRNSLPLTPIGKVDFVALQNESV